MATIHDLFEITSVLANTTYSKVAGTLLGVVDNVTSTALGDGEFDIGDALNIGGAAFTITALQKPTSNGSFQLSSGSNVTFSSASESNLQVAFLTVSNGTTTRYFAVPNDSFGDFRIQAIQTGTLSGAAGSDAAVISTTNNATGVDCFARGTWIATPNGHARIETLQVGDLVLTRDHGPQPVRLRLIRELDFAQAPFKLRPIALEAGALGKNKPSARLAVSPQHRILVADSKGQEVLVPARSLIARKGIRVMQGVRNVVYYHLVFSQHELIFANGILTESFYPGPMALKSVGPACKSELLEIYGQAALRDDVFILPPAAPLIPMQKARKLMAELC
jgi:hypothetical protein